MTLVTPITTTGHQEGTQILWGPEMHSAGDPFSGKEGTVANTKLETKGSIYFG